MNLSTGAVMLDVELPKLIESPSVSTFLPDEEASICPLLLSSSFRTQTAPAHPLAVFANDQTDEDKCLATQLCSTDCKAETSSSSGSSLGAYHHLQSLNNAQESNGHCLNFSSKTPSFVSWNWPVIRKCTIFLFISCFLAIISVVITMIATLPKSCTPKTAWYRGSVFYEIFPASYQDSNDDGVGDLQGIIKRIDYLKTLGISAVRLNSIFPTHHYPEDYENVTTLFDVAPVLGDLIDIKTLIEVLHGHNISLILDLPFSSSDTDYIRIVAKSSISGLSNSTSRHKSHITKAIRFWIGMGVDGFYIKNIQNIPNDLNLIESLKEWKSLLGSDRVLIVNESIIVNLSFTERLSALSHIDLMDVHLNVYNESKHLQNDIKRFLSHEFSPNDDGTWIHWSIGRVSKSHTNFEQHNLNLSLATTIMQLILPGTPSIFYGDEISLQPDKHSQGEHNETNHLHHLPPMIWRNRSSQFTSAKTLPWLPQSNIYALDNFSPIERMIKLRNQSPSIYKNSIRKEDITVTNTQIHHKAENVLIIERIYPRRNTFVSVTNFNQKQISLDISSLYYSGRIMLKREQSEKVYFNNFKIGPFETIVVKLDK